MDYLIRLLIIIALMGIGCYFNFFLRHDGNYVVWNFLIALLFIFIFLAFSYYSGVHGERIAKRLLWLYIGLGSFMTISYYFLYGEVLKILSVPLKILMASIFSPLMGLSYLDIGFSPFGVSAVLTGLAGIVLYKLGEKRI